MTRPALVITCEHGGNHIPAAYRQLFEGQEATLHSHRGFDAGALKMAETLAEAFGAPLVSATVSRLLVDLNRSTHNPTLHAEVVRRLPATQRQEILARFYQPYRSRAEQAIRQAIADHGAVIHLSSHSFTPELDGRLRKADIGLLYDPRRPGEAALCRHWKAALAVAAPQLTVRRNYPYAGKGDGLTAWLRRCLGPDVYVGVELEINQKHVTADGDCPALRHEIVESLREALSHVQHPPRARGAPP
jgi:predicted N-formylglutamate amidohydrolase